MFPDGRVFGAKFRRGYELFVLAEERKEKERKKPNFWNCWDERAFFSVELVVQIVQTVVVCCGGRRETSKAAPSFFFGQDIYLLLTVGAVNGLPDLSKKRTALISKKSDIRDLR